MIRLLIILFHTWQPKFVYLTIRSKKNVSVLSVVICSLCVASYVDVDHLGNWHFQSSWTKSVGRKMYRVIKGMTCQQIHKMHSLYAVRWICCSNLSACSIRKRSECHISIQHRILANALLYQIMLQITIPKKWLVCEHLGCTRREELMHFHFHFRLLFLFCVWA